MAVGLEREGSELSGSQPRGVTAGDAKAGRAPERAGLVLVTLILVAGVANLTLSVANVALPDIGKSFDSSQTTLDLIAVGYSLSLAASVLWFGALGDPAHVGAPGAPVPVRAAYIPPAESR
jgi:MFS family permease